MAKWQPIETAPRNGRDILVGHPDGSCAVVAWRRGGWRDGTLHLLDWPTHWMPLSPPPTDAPATAEEET